MNIKKPSDYMFKLTLSMRATFIEIICKVNPVLTSNIPHNHYFLRSLTYTDASTTSHTPHMHAQNGWDDGGRILQGYDGRRSLEL